MTHPDTDVLAEFRVGLITGRRGARIAAHLAGCDHCAALDGQLTEISALLAAVPAPAMPESVAQRLDAVLAAEVANQDHPERAVVRGPRERQTHKRPAGHRGFRLVALRVLAPAAAVLLAAGGYGLSRIGNGPPPNVASGAEGRAVPPVAQPAYRPLTPMPTTAPANSASSAGSASFTFVTSGTRYQRATLRQQLKAEMSASASASSPAQAPSQQTVACVFHVTGGVNPIFVDRASFDGQPATIIVVRTSKGEQAWVAGASCSATNRDVLAATTLP